MFDAQVIESDIGIVFKDKELIKQAFCHKSYHKENPDCPHNEKLEFLGDAVLDLVISDILMDQFSQDNEGSLSRKRASIVNEESLFELAKTRNMDQHLLVGKREAQSQLQQNSRIVASVFEAVIGAIYQDAGFDRVFRWIQEVFANHLDGAFEQHDFEKDYKTRFQEWVQEKHKTTPVYKVIDQSGPDHHKVFSVEVFVNGQSWGVAQGASKKAAAQNAAQKALEGLDQ